MTMRIYERIPVGMLQCNCYIVGDPETREAIVIDPGDQPDDILAALQRHELTPVVLVATHAHFDHVLGADLLRERTGAPFSLHRDDRPLLEAMQDRGLRFMGIELPPPPDVDSHHRDGDEIVAGAVRLGVVHTPGHSPGSVSLVADGEAIFSGDTLFAGSIGRTDLPGGDADRELASIRERLFPLGDLPVYPGHGPQTSIEREKVENPFVGSRSRLWTP
jgi:glyoxylase-like metal-dependent hydrolase (beta-lactamase superfamily II)